MAPSWVFACVCVCLHAHGVVWMCDDLWRFIWIWFLFELIIDVIYVLSTFMLCQVACVVLSQEFQCPVWPCVVLCTWQQKNLCVLENVGTSLCVNVNTPVCVLQRETDADSSGPFFWQACTASLWSYSLGEFSDFRQTSSSFCPPAKHARHIRFNVSISLRSSYILH